MQAKQNEELVKGRRHFWSQSTYLVFATCDSSPTRGLALSGAALM